MRRALIVLTVGVLTLLASAGPAQATLCYGC